MYITNKTQETFRTVIEGEILHLDDANKAAKELASGILTLAEKDNIQAIDYMLTRINNHTAYHEYEED